MADKYPGWSPYNYVLNNPVRLFDPDGQDPCCLGMGYLLGVVKHAQAFAGDKKAQKQLKQVYTEIARTGVEVAADTYGDVFEATTGYTITGREGNRTTALMAAVIPGVSSAVLKRFKGLLPRFSTATISDAKGLVGKEFEEFLVDNLGGSSAFKVDGREFDVAVGNNWIEAKSGGYWDLLSSDSSAMNKFKSTIAQQQTIAHKNGATFELISNTPIPQNIKDWLSEKGISFTELVEQ